MDFGIVTYSDIEVLRSATAQGRIHWHQHALERFLERGISRAEVVTAIMNGEVIEVYPTDRPNPSCLILHVESDPLHVVAAADSACFRYSYSRLNQTDQIDRSPVSLVSRVPLFSHSLTPEM
ncbi:MAG: DUF4258 domain-containing protein [Nitrospirota bacterium]|nr:DUF4258 domain-containing protein [Nitrospirota bacterium]